MPSVATKKKETDKLVIFEVCTDNGKCIKVKTSRVPKLIKWRSGSNRRFTSIDEKYKVKFSREREYYLVFEKIIEGSTKTKGDNKIVSYKEINKEFCNECYQLCDKKDIIYSNPKFPPHIEPRKKGWKVCKNCKATLKSCDKCNKLVLQDIISSVIAPKKSDSLYCPECCILHTKRCGRCGNAYEGEHQGSRYYQEMFYCHNCVPEVFRECGHCHKVFHNEEMRHHRRSYYCRECIENVMVIKEYNFTPKHFDIYKLGWDNKLCLGIEVEVERNGNTEENEIWAAKSMEYIKSIGLGHLFYIKHDGTVQGFELVCQPATLQYFHTNVPWFKILKWFSTNGFTSYKSGSCGLHVHLSKDFFTPVDVHKIRLFFSTNKVFIYKFSKRFGYNDSYCKYETFKPSDFIKDGKRQDGKYWACRTRPGKKNTVELRVFRGTLSYPRFLATLQFCDALAHYVKMVSIVSCQKKSSWVSFMQWCTKTNTYQHFINYIKNNEELGNQAEV